MSSSSWVMRHLRGDDPETFADALLLVEQLAQSLNNMLRRRKATDPAWESDPLALAAQQHLNEFIEGPK